MSAVDDALVCKYRTLEEAIEWETGALDNAAQSISKITRRLTSLKEEFGEIEAELDKRGHTF